MQQHVAHVTDSLGWVKAFRAHVDAVHDAAAAEHAERVIKRSQTFIGAGVTAVSQETVGLQQRSRTQELVGVPPEGRAGSRAASAQNALVQTIELFALFRSLQTFDGRSRRVILQERLHLLVLLVEDAHIDDQVTNDRQTRQRTYDQLVLGNNGRQRRDAGQTVLAIDVHAIGTAHAFAARTTVREALILFFDQGEHVQHHQVLATGIDLKLLHERRGVLLRVVTINTDLQHIGHPLISPNLRFKSRNSLRREVHGTLGHALVTREIQGVAQPVLVIAIFKVFTGVSAAGLFTMLCGDRRGFGNFQQVLQFKRFDTGGIECLALVVDLDVGDTHAQVSQLSNTLLHVFAGAEHTEVVLHAALQLFTQRGDVFAGSALVQAGNACQRSIDIGLGSTGVVDTFAQRFLQVDTCSATEHNQIEQRVAAQTVCTVNRYASHFTYREQTRNDLIDTGGVLSDRLTMNVGGNAAHHVMAGRNYRNRRCCRVDVSEGLGQLHNAWQTAVQHFFAQVIELEHYMVAIRTAAVTGNDFLDHGARNHVTTCKVLGVRSITLHETLAVLVDQVTALTTAAFGDQYTCTGNAGRVELPHFDVLNRDTGTQCHTDTVTGIDQGIGGRRVDTTCTAGCQHGSVGTDVGGFAGFNADGDDADKGTVLILDQIHAVVFVEEYGASLEVGLIKGVQQCVTSTVGSSTGTCSLTALAEVLGLTAKRTLVDATLFGTGERQTHVLEFENSFRAYGTHVFDSVLVTDVVGTLDGIVHVPAPVIVRIGRGNCAGDATLGRNGVRACREHLGDHGSLVTALSELQGSAHTGTATTNDDGVEGKRIYVSHESDTPKNLHAPDEVGEHQNAAYCLKQKTYCSGRLAQRHRRQVVGRDGPHADPGVSAKGNESQQTEDTHSVVCEQIMPLGVTQTRMKDHVSDQEYEISREHDRRNTLSHPVIEARTRKVGDVGYHIHTPARRISTTETAITILEPSLPPSSVSPTPESMMR
ncbi:hypothetical protein ALP76_05479 [Pseudomonas savastanoi pv. glycinea]|nr:hypothetical protein ALP76_05479 [Pseudomonas savastanoi pv. glycinea]